MEHNKQIQDRQQPDVPTYNELSDYQKKCLPTTNFWRIAFGQPVIEVPPQDKNYWSQITPKWFSDAQRIARERRRVEKLN